MHKKLKYVLLITPFLLFTFSTSRLDADTTVFQCLDNQGQSLFQQTPCEDNSGREVRIINDYAGEGGGLRPGEKALLKEWGDSARRGKRKPSTGRTDHSNIKVETRACWNKRQRLDAVNARLRRGYKPAHGIRLREKRSEYEGYLRRYCP